MVDDYDLTKISLTLDILGFYFPVTEKAIVGFIINGAADQFSKDDDWIQYNSYLYSASGIYYPGNEFGSGFFLRADAGMAAFVITDSEDNSEKADNGFGFLMGGGYSVNFGGTRLLLNLNYAHRGVKLYDLDKVDVIGFSIGGLF